MHTNNKSTLLDAKSESSTWISIGMQCTSATFLQKLCKRKESYPFDWMLSNPKFVYEMLELLLDKNMEINKLVKEYFFLIDDGMMVDLVDKKTNTDCVEHYYTSKNGRFIYNSRHAVIFPHSKNNDETICGYVRRFERLKKLILDQSRSIRFIYTSQSSIGRGNFTIDKCEIIKDVYYYINKIHELISKYKENFDIILFDSISNDDPTILNKEITLIKIESCDIWGGLIPQMINRITI